MRELQAKIDLMRAVVNTALPAACKKKLGEPIQKLLLEHLNDLENAIKELYI